MIKRTLYFGHPAYLSLKLGQIVIRKPLDSNSCSSDDKTIKGEQIDIQKTLPIEDIGIIVLDNKQITITQALIENLLENNCALITCDSRHLPVGLLLPLCGNTIQNERFRNQIDSSLPLKKQLWQQTIIQKIKNQATVLEHSTHRIHKNMLVWASSVRSGDPENLEARAAAYYWKNLFPDNQNFTRGRFEDNPNGILNYGYAILRAVVARALVCSGLLPTLGIHHHNRYNTYCLADDIMEPYRPFVDRIAVDLFNNNQTVELTQETKVILLSIPTIEVRIAGQRSPLMVAVTKTTASLCKCFSGESRRILYPEL